MPAAITHYLQAQRVMAELKKQRFGFVPNENAFLWGAQGPDFLYCHRYLPWKRDVRLKEYGSKLHKEKPSETLAVLREYYCTQNRNVTVLSYIYGFLCHYSLDRIGHPFIHYRAHELLKRYPEQNDSILHHQTESALDVIMLRYERSELPVDFNLKQTVPKNTDVQTVIADLYAYLCNRLFDLTDAGVPLLQSTYDCRTVFGLLNDRTTLKKTIIERIERKNGKMYISSHIRGISEGDDYDYANILLADWRWPLNSSTVRNESFFELYQCSVSKSVELIKNFLTADDFCRLTDNIPFV